MVIVSDGQTHIPEDDAGAFDDAVARLDETDVVRTVFQIGSNPDIGVLRQLASSSGDLLSLNDAVRKQGPDLEKLLFTLECRDSETLPLILASQIWEQIRHHVPCVCSPVTTTSTTTTTTATTTTAESNCLKDVVCVIDDSASIVDPKFGGAPAAWPFQSIDTLHRMGD